MRILPGAAALAACLVLAFGTASVASPRAMEALDLGAPPKPWPVPDFTLRALTGGTLGTKDVKGRVVLINFWTTWCAPCRIEMPVLDKLYRQYKDRGFVVIGISNDLSDDVVRRFVRELDITFPILLDPDYEVSTKFRVMGLPGTFIVGRDGLIRARGYGPREWDRPEAGELIRFLLDH